MVGIKTCLIVEDIDSTLQWLKQCVLLALPEIVCTTATTCETAIPLTESQSFDVALIDLSLPDGSGLDLIKQIRKNSSETIITVVTIHDDDNHIFTALKNGANGYLLKDVAQEKFVEQIQGIISGIPPLSPAIALKLIDYFATPEEDAEPLTSREQDVLKLIARGMSSGDTGEALGISRNTVLSYIKTIYRKLGISSRAEASMEAHRRGLV